MKKLICKANEIIRSKAEAIKLKTGLKLSTLHTLILQDAIGRTATKTAAWARHCKTTDAEVDEERKLILKEMAGYTELGLSLGRTFHSLIEDWVDELTMLLMDVFAHKAAVQKIQEKYFNGHPILYCDAEAELAGAIKSVEDAASTFNEYLAVRNALFKSDSNPKRRLGDVASSIPSEREGHLVINIQDIQAQAEDFLIDYIADEWAKEFKEKATADILQETGEHEGYIWQAFRDRARL